MISLIMTIMVIAFIGQHYFPLKFVSLQISVLT